ncbi:MAG: hypothetical protein AB8G86_09620 [Saprospiraceae bacterium]
MKKAIIRNWLLFGILLFSSQVFSQIAETFRRTDVVYLKNGSIFRGQIEVYEKDKELQLRIATDKVMVIEAKSIKKIVQESTESEKAAQVQTAKVIKPYAFKERGLHFHTAIGYIGGNNQFGDYTNAFNVHFQSIYQFNRLIGTGLGVGVDFYNVHLGSILPIYVSTRGYLKASSISPYYHLAGGYGIPVIQGETSGFTATKGGYYFAPEFGFKFGGTKETSFTMGIGLQWQKATYILDFADTISKNEDTYTFRRFNFKIGILF